MARLGLDDRPEVFEWHTEELNQQANPLTVPERSRIITLGAWLRGVSGYGSVNYRLVVWNPNGTVRAQTAGQSIGTAAVAVGNLLRVEHDLTAPLDVDAGEAVWIGFASSSTGAIQFGWHDHGSSSSHREKTTASWPVSMSGASTHGSTGAVGAWIERYDPIAGAWIRRGGSWTRADAVRVRRSGAWVEVDGVRVRRSGSWSDAD